MDEVSLNAAQEERREWRLLWLGSIQAFADSYAQKTRWPAAGKANPRFSFVDCMSAYFDGAYLREPDAYDKRLAAGQVTTAEVAAVNKFHSLAECYESPTGDDWASEAILRDPNWKEVVAAACEAQERLLPLLTDEAERKALTTPFYGEEKADAELVASSVHGSDIGGFPQNVGGSGLGVLVLTKPATAATSHVPADVRRQLLPLGFRADKTESGVRYRIGPFALSRNTNMFAAYSQVRLVQESGSWVLRLTLNKALWLVFLIFPLALLGKHPINAQGVGKLAEGFALAAAIFSAAVFWSWTRVSRWWKRL
ncbi:MAG: hypothetical protein V4499_07395 [Pseudomonadota bacterium]